MADWEDRLDEDSDNFDAGYYERVKTDIELEVLLCLNLIILIVHAVHLTDIEVDFCSLLI